MWHIENLRADNDATCPKAVMRISADAVAFYNPATKAVEGETIDPILLSNLPCSIAIVGPGGRDSDIAYVTGDVPWWYLIYNSASGLVDTVNSLVAPDFGPALPAGFTSYCPCFPTIFPPGASVTMEPIGSLSGPTKICVRGNQVTYPNRVLMPSKGYPTFTVNMGNWIPPCAIETDFTTDAEIHASAGGPVIGGLVLSTPDGAFQNISLYPVQSWWQAQDIYTCAVLDNFKQTFTGAFSNSGGVIDNAVADFFIIGYKFG